MSPLLETRALAKRFGGVTVAKDIDFALASGDLHCLIGPNGAGKSTFFKLLLGEHTPDAGQVRFRDRDITKLRPFARIRKGISVKFQVPGIFRALSVRQNLEIALQHHLHGNDLDATIAKMLDFTGLAAQAGVTAGTLSHGQQQWLEIGMAVGVEPALLLLDEPTAGMSPDETYQTGEMLRELNARGMTVLAIEHDMAFVQQIAREVTVLHFGEVFARGTVEEITAHEGVEAIYLGTADVD